MNRISPLTACATGLGALIVAGLTVWHLSGGTSPTSAPAPLPASATGYAGSETCTACHTEQNADWMTSHHAMAMADPTDNTVLGDFNDAEVVYNGLRTTFSRDGAAFVVRTEDVPGAPRTYRIHATFGVTPLQQYLVETGDGWVQPLPYAWDARPREDGGQRWYHLYPEGGENSTITPGDPLHWTHRQQNWNQMCATCHSTNLVSDFDIPTQTFHTRFTDINVGCEACHGPGQAHVDFRTANPDPATPYTSAAQDLLGHLQSYAAPDTWTHADGTATAHLTDIAPEALHDRQAEIEVCATCHSRRAPLTGHWDPKQPFMDQFLPMLLDEDLYFHDGQIKDEVFVYGSFLQSKMFANGVTCTDCHDPHTNRTVREGNALCTTCHAAPVFDTPAHHHHPVDMAGAQCVSCHMPTRTYMGVDARRDHSLRIPRPDISAKIGAPDPCTTCHTEQSADWAAEAIALWHGPAGPDRHAALVMADVRAGVPYAAATAARTLATDADLPEITRGTLAAAIGTHPRGRAQVPTLRALVDHGTPLAAIGAMRGVAPLTSPEERAGILGPKLSAPLLAVRLEAVRHLAGDPEEFLSPDRKQAFDRAFEEFRAMVDGNAERPENHYSLASLYMAQNKLPEALAAFRTALDLDPLLPPVYVNYAEALRATGDEAAAAALLKDGVAKLPDAAILHHAYGLALIRQKDYRGALASLETAADLAPNNPRFAYVYAVALFETGAQTKAVSTLRQALTRAPNDPELLTALTQYLQAMGRTGEAEMFRKRLEGR